MHRTNEEFWEDFIDEVEEEATEKEEGEEE